MFNYQVPKKASFLKETQKHSFQKADITIVGAGIVGIMSAYIINRLSPDSCITVIDAGKKPALLRTTLESMQGATFGPGADARHFTGTEGLSLQNPVHAKAVSLHPDNQTGYAGWQTCTEESLTIPEQRWRSELIWRYFNLEENDINSYDICHTSLNYAGMESWKLLEAIEPKISRFKITDNVYVFFQTEEECSSDFLMESSFDPYQKYFLKTRVSMIPVSSVPSSIYDLINRGTVAPYCLQVPGSAWRIQSMTYWLLQELEKNPNVKIQYDSPIETMDTLPVSSSNIWAIGACAKLPSLIAKKNRIQGLGGFWVTIPNFGITVPFKIRAPQPSGYINFTPDGNVIHISGGFGWIGNRSYNEGLEYLESTKRHFLNHLTYFLGIPLAKFHEYGVRTCIRPSTPTGLPDIKSFSIEERNHLVVGGSCKAGATQAPLLALYVAMETGLADQVETLISGCSDFGTIVKEGLSTLKELEN